MPSRTLSDREVEQLASWPVEVARSDLAAFFTLSVEDLRWVRSIRSPRAAADRIGLAVQLCALPFLGFIPAELASTPAEVVERLAQRIGVAPGELVCYVELVSERSCREHAQAVIARAGWRACGPAEWRALGDWLLTRALEHDTQSVLFRQALDHLQSEKIVRPGPDRLMRAVASARAAATREIHQRLLQHLIPELCARLDALVVTDPDFGVAPLVWLGDGATGASPESVKAELVKLAHLRGLGADRLDLSAIPPERLRQLAMIARRSTPRALRQMAPERRYPILLAALAARHTEIVDELVRLFDQALAGTDSRARDRLAARQAELVAADVGRLILLDEMLGVVLDAGRDDAAVGAALRDLGQDRLARAVRGEDERLPRDGGHLALVEASYSHVRAFAPQVLAALSFAASVTPSDVLDGVQLLQAMNADGRRHVPEGAPTSFVPARWRPYLERAQAVGEENLHKHYWELCVLFALQGSLRSGEIWVQGSRRYANPASYLIPVEDWPAQREEVLALAGMPARSPSGSRRSTLTSPATSTTSRCCSPIGTARFASMSTASFTSARSPRRSSTRPCWPSVTRSSRGYPRCR